MKKFLLLSAGALMLSASLSAQRNCGMQLMIDQQELQNPGFRDKIGALKLQNQLSTAAFRDQETNWATAKTTASPSIAVVFHVVLDSSQVSTIGGVAGIESRLKSQMEVLNNDFNGENADSSKVPGVWKPLFAHTGIRFAMATVGPDGFPTPGYDMRYVASPSSFSVANACRNAKKYSTGGLDPWDNTKYLNIWIVNISAGSSTVLGVTAPPKFLTDADNGIALNYLAFGVRQKISDKFVTNIDKGRTLTHEMGHYFYIWHIWGDDAGLCPSDAGGDDDGISDTPPQADQSYGSSVFPKYDKCSPAGTSNGIMFMNYMDYSDDAYMYMFTQEQASNMRAQVAPGGYSYSLTQHPELSVGEVTRNTSSLHIVPNPTTGPLTISADASLGQLQEIRVLDMTGRLAASFTTASNGNIDLSHLSKGLYLVQCRYEQVTITQKIVLQ
jgi:hypothetical protein